MSLKLKDLSWIFYFMKKLFNYMSEPKEKKEEDFAKEFMAKEGLKGKARRIKIMKIINTVGYDKRKIKTALAKATINESI